MDENKITLCWPNSGDAAALTGGNWRPELPLGNLQTRRYGQRARSLTTALADTTFTATFSAPQRILALALASHNLSALAQWRVRFYGDAAKSRLLWDSADEYTNYLLHTQSFNSGPWFWGEKGSPPQILKTAVFSTSSLPDGEPPSGKALFITANGLGATTYTPSQDVVLNEGFYNFSAWFRRLRHDAPHARLFIGDVLVASTADGLDWQRIGGTLFLPSGTHTMKVQFYGGVFTGAPGEAILHYQPQLTDSSKPTRSIFTTSAPVKTFFGYGQQGAVWPNYYTSDTLEWEDNSFWAGSLPATLLGEFTPLAFMFADRLTYNVAAIQVDLRDVANPDGFVEVGRLFCAQGWQPKVNVAYGISFGTENTTGVDSALDSTDYFDRRRQKRTVDFALDELSESEAFNALYALRRDQGTDREILFAFDTLNNSASYYRTFLGRLAKQDAIAQPHFKTFASTISLKELL